MSPAEVDQLTAALDELEAALVSLRDWFIDAREGRVAHG